MKQGDFVVVRAFGGKPLIRRVWEEDSPNAVYVHSEDAYRRHLDDRETLGPIGFPWEDVFVYDSDTFPKDVEGVHQDDTFWATLKGVKF